MVWVMGAAGLGKDLGMEPFPHFWRRRKADNESC